MLNLPYLLDYVMREVLPLDWQAVVRSDIPLKVGAALRRGGPSLRSWAGPVPREAAEQQWAQGGLAW